MRTATLISALTVLVGTTVVPAAEGPFRADALLSGCSDPSVHGTVRLVEERSEEGVKQVRVHLRVRGLADGKHAVHIHENAACEPCGAAGGHFDPGPAGFSSPDGNHPFHAGDLVNVEVRNGFGAMDAVTSRVTISPGPLSILDDDGSAVIVHVASDSYCPDGAEAGCAGGARAACGVLVPVD